MRRFRLSLIALAAAAGCTTSTGRVVHRELGGALHGMRDRVAALAAPGGLAGPDGRPMLLDLRNAVRDLPRTLRLDTPPFPDYHAATRLSAASASWRPSTVLSRGLAKLRW